VTAEGCGAGCWPARSGQARRERCRRERDRTDHPVMRVSVDRRRRVGSRTL